MILLIICCCLFSLSCNYIANEKEPLNLINVQDTSLLEKSLNWSSYELKISLDPPVFTDSIAYLVLKWRDELPANVRSELIAKKVLIEKKYYLTDIELTNEAKVVAIQVYNRRLEEFLDLKIGRYQGIPSVIFSTSIVSFREGDGDNDDFLEMRINQLKY